MVKETPKSLRLFFGVVAGLSFIVFAGAVSQVILLLREHPDAQLSPLFIAQSAFRLLIAVAFTYVVVKFKRLIKESPKTIKAIVHANFFGSLVLVVANIAAGIQLNYLGLVISVVVYVYLLKSVDRISKAPLTSP